MSPVIALPICDSDGDEKQAGISRSQYLWGRTSSGGPRGVSLNRSHFPGAGFKGRAEICWLSHSLSGRDRERATRGTVTARCDSCHGRGTAPLADTAVQLETQPESASYCTHKGTSADSGGDGKGKPGRTSIPTLQAPGHCTDFILDPKESWVTSAQIPESNLLRFPPTPGLVHIEQARLRNQTSWVQIPTPQLPSCVIRGKLLNLSGPQCAHL